MASSSMIFVILFILIILSGCGEEPDAEVRDDHQVEYESAPIDSMGIESAASPGLTQCTLSVRSDLEPFEISLYWVGHPEAVPGFRLAHTLTAEPLIGDSIVVFDGLESNYYENSELQDYLIAEDMNFDGYTDFRLMQFPTAGPNTYWYFWLFDPDTGTFFRSMEFEESSLVSPEFDQGSKMIKCFHRDGMGIYGTEYYFIEEGHLLLVRSEQTEFQGPDSLITTVTELVNDEMIVTERNVQEVD